MVALNLFFYLLGLRIKKKGLLDLEPQFFSSLRIEAEKQALAENTFFNINDIYRHFHYISKVDSSLIQPLIEEEFMEEGLHIFGNQIS